MCCQELPPDSHGFYRTLVRVKGLQALYGAKAQRRLPQLKLGRSCGRYLLMPMIDLVGTEL